MLLCLFTVPVLKLQSLRGSQRMIDAVVISASYSSNKHKEFLCEFLCNYFRVTLLFPPACVVIISCRGKL